MGVASIVMRDMPDGSCGMEVVYGDGFDKTSPAHAGIRRVLQYIDSLGIEILEPPKPETMAAPAGVM
jgi:hypothetical protein